MKALASQHGAASFPVAGGRGRPGPPRHGQFYQRLLDVAQVAEGSANHEQVFYVRMVKERFGLDLLAFLEEEAPLTWETVSAVRACEPYRILAEYRDRLLALDPEGALAAELDQAAGHPLGVDAIGVRCWNRANLLMEQTFALLELRTLNAPFLERD